MLIRNLNWTKLALLSVLFATFSNAALAVPLGWRKSWEQGQNEWGWGDWGRPRGTGFYVSCPDSPDNGDRDIFARVSGDLETARLTFPNGHHYNLPIAKDEFGQVWGDLRNNKVMTVTSGAKKAMIPLDGARKILPANVCPM